MALIKTLKRNNIIYSIQLSGNYISPETATIYINKSSDGGTTWSLYDTLDMNVSMGDDQSLDAIIVDDTIHFVFSIRTTTSPVSNGNIYYHTYNIDSKIINGASSPFTASVFTAGHNPSIALDPSNNNVMMVFESRENYPWSSIKKSNLTEATTESYIVSAYLMRNPQLAITSVGGNEGLFIFYYDHNGLYSNPKIYNFSTGFKTLLPTRSIAPKECFDLSGSIYVDESDKVYILFTSLVDNSNNSGSGEFSGFSTIVDLISSDDLFLTTTIENIFDISNSNFYIHTSTSITPNDEEFFLSAAAFKDDTSDYNSLKFSDITTLFKSGLPSLWSGTRTVSKYSKGNTILPNVSVTSLNDAMHAITLQSPKGNSKDITYNLLRPTTVYTSILRTDFVTTAIDEEVSTSTLCLLPDSSPEEYNINVPEDTLRILGTSTQGPSDFAIHPDTGNIYVIFNTKRATSSFGNNFGGTLEVYNYKTKEIISRKVFDGKLDSIDIDPNGKIWLVQLTSKQNDGFDTASWACNVLMVLNPTTLVPERRFFCSYQNSNPSDYSNISAPGDSLDAGGNTMALLAFKNENGATVKILGDYAVFFHNNYLYFYEWNNLDNLPVTTDFVKFEQNTNETYTVYAPWPSIGTDIYPFEAAGTTPPDWYDTTYGAVKYLPNLVIYMTGAGSNDSYLTALFVNDWCIWCWGTVVNALDLLTWPLNYGGSPAEDTNSAGQCFRSFNNNNPLSVSSHPSIIRVDQYYGTTDQRFTNSPQGQCSLIYNELADEVLIGVGSIRDTIGNIITNYNGFVRVNSGRHATDDPFEFVANPSSGGAFLNNATYNKDPNRTDDLDTIIPVSSYNPCRDAIIDNCQNLWNFDSASSTLDYADFDAGKNTSCRMTVLNLNNLTCYNGYIHGFPTDGASGYRSKFIQHPISGDVYFAICTKGGSGITTGIQHYFLKIFRKIKYKDLVTETFYNTVTSLSPVEWWKTEDTDSSPNMLLAENNSAANLYLQSGSSPGNIPLFREKFYLFPAIYGIEFRSNDWGFISNWSTSSPDQSNRLALTGDMTFCVFIRFDAAFNISAGTHMTLINFETIPPATPQTIYSFGLSGSGEYGGWYTKHGDPTPAVSPDPNEHLDYKTINGNLNGYYAEDFCEIFFTFTRDSVNKKIKFYINSVLADTFKYDSNPTLDGAGTLSIGSDINVDNNNLTDETVIGCPILFDRVLSTTEIRSLYNAAKGY